MYGNNIGYLTIYQYTFKPDFGAFTRSTIYKEGGYSVRDIEDTSSFWTERAVPVELGEGEDVYVSIQQQIHCQMKRFLTSTCCTSTRDKLVNAYVCIAV